MKSAHTCLDARRLLLASPTQSIEQIDEHLTTCAACREYQNQLIQDEQRLQRALSISVPDGLADRVLLNVRMQSQPRIPYWAIAASLLLLTGSTFWWFALSTPDINWAAVAAEHVATETESLNKVDNNADKNLNTLLALWHVNLRESLGRVLYADQCAFPHGRGMHAVFETDQLGKITLILPPENSVGSNDLSQIGDFHAESFELNGKWMAVVSDDKRKLKSARAWITERLVVL